MRLACPSSKHMCMYMREKTILTEAAALQCLILH